MGMSGIALRAIEMWLTREERRQDRDDETVHAVLRAVNKTQQYVAQRNRGVAVDREAEAQLTELWTIAAVKIRRTDPDLAARLQVKAMYWTNPEMWTDEDVVASDIALDDISLRANSLLKAV